MTDRVNVMLPKAHSPKQITCIPVFCFVLPLSITLCPLPLHVSHLSLPLLLAIKLDKNRVLQKVPLQGDMTINS